MQAIEHETTPGKQHGIVSLVGHRQRRAVELLPAIMLARRLLGEVCQGLEIRNIVSKPRSLELLPAIMLIDSRCSRV